MANKSTAYLVISTPEMQLAEPVISVGFSAQDVVLPYFVTEIVIFYNYRGRASKFSWNFDQVLRVRHHTAFRYSLLSDSSSSLSTLSPTSR